MMTRKNTRKGLFISVLLVITFLTVFISPTNNPPIRASAHAVDVFGPACGKATIDGKVNVSEWSSASTKTFTMKSPGGAPAFTATLYVMTSGHYLYMGITINDDEFSTYAPTVQGGDTFVINFDNDHSGSLNKLNDDVLDIFAALPQFLDNYINIDLTESNMTDISGGGTADGIGAASRVGGFNHFEVKHPLCSGDSLDFCLHPSDTVGFRLRYLDVQANESIGSSQYYPDKSATSEADIVIGACSEIYLPLIVK